MKNMEIDLEPASASIDTYAKAKLTGGDGVLIHLRLQKWFQPDLDRILFESSRIIGGVSLAANELVKWIPAGATKAGQGFFSFRPIPDAAGFEDDAPVRGSKPPSAA